MFQNGLNYSIGMISTEINYIGQARGSNSIKQFQSKKRLNKS